MSDDRIEGSRGADDSASKPDGDTNDAVPGKETHARRLNDQGVWFVTAGRPHLAVRCFRRACVAWPLLAVAWTNLAATLVMLGRGREAMAAIRGAVQAGAMSRSDATRHRATIRQNVSPEQLIAHRHPVPPEQTNREPFRRPNSAPKSLPRKSASIYILLRTAAYDMHCENRIPAA